MIPANKAMKITAQLDRSLDGLFMVLMEFWGTSFGSIKWRFAA
jgi:hypothetical protein